MNINKIHRKSRAWLRRHSYSFFSSLGVLLQHKIGTLMTVLVLGIAMLLPLGLYATLANLEGIDLRQEEWGAVTVFFKPGTTQSEVKRVAEELKINLQPDTVVIISPDEGMAEFRDVSGFGGSLDMLAENPLPWVMQVSPNSGAPAIVQQRVEDISRYLDKQENVERIHFDFKWLQRLGRMMELGQATVTVLGILFGLAVVVVVSNTIRLDVASRTDEIEILALVGASHAFVRQPFLYSGLWYGLMGGILSIVLLQLTLLYLGRPLGLLLETYGTVFSLKGLGISNTAWLLFSAGFLGWLGAWIAVQRYLRQLRVGGRLGRH